MITGVATIGYTLNVNYLVICQLRKPSNYPIGWPATRDCPAAL